MAKMKFRIAGVRPLLMRSGRLADPLDPAAETIARLTAKRLKTPADLNAIAHAEWAGGLWLSGGRPCLPAEALDACILAGARSRRLGRVAAASVVCTAHAPLIFDGPHDLGKLWEDPRFRLRTGVCVSRGRVFRTRPRFLEWEAEIELEVLESMLDAQRLRDILSFAGAHIGIGDWRPKYGLFRVL